MAYDLKSVHLPRLAGFPLKAAVAFIETPGVRSLVAPKLIKDAGFDALRSEFPDHAPATYPVFSYAAAEVDGAAPDLEKLCETTPQPTGFAFRTVRDFARAYREGTTTPEQVAQRVFDAVRKSDAASPALRAFIACDEVDLMKQARESTERFAAGSPLSIFDGVPVAVKDELDQVPYPSTVGTTFLGTSPATEDATPVARFRAAGAMLIGKANMHEIGIGVTGFNPHHGPARNPYNTDCITGGSSSGSAAAVAAGLCPVSVGADGGGSIRIPAALCGVVGLKATFSRISEFGAAPLCWSVAHVGPLASTVRDTALAYALMAGPDPKDHLSNHQPPVHLNNLEETDLTGLKIGIYRPWFDHASSDIVHTCRHAMSIFETHGATVQHIEIPNLEAIRLAHLVTIASEMLTAMGPYYGNHRKDFGLDVRTNLALTRFFTSEDYIKSQRIRARAIEDFLEIFSTVDVIVTPSTGLTAPIIPDDALPDGESNLTVLTEIMRYASQSNLTGIPAISVPVGYDPGGLPIGLQLMGRPWEEHRLLQIASVVESHIEKTRPAMYFDLLADLD